MYGDSDLDHQIGHDFGVPVVYGSQAAVAQLDEKGDEVLRGHVSGVSSTDISIFLRTTALTGLAMGAAITVDGANYVIRNFQAEDAQTTRVYLRKA